VLNNGRNQLNMPVHAFWDQLALITELSNVDGSDFLELGAGACFPLEGSNVANKLLVRQSYKDLHALMLQHFERQGRSFIITGKPGDVIACYRTCTGGCMRQLITTLHIFVPWCAGIGKSLFLYYLLWHLARNKATVVYDRRDRMPVMFTADSVYKGALELFEDNLQQPNTW
jgi:hypothetical protein